MAGRPHRYHLSILGRKYILKWWRQTFRVESRRHPSCDEIFILLFLLFDYTHGFVCRALSQIFSAAFVLRRNQRPTMALSYFLGVAFCRRAIYWVSSSKCLFVLCRVCFRVSCEFRSHTHTRRDRVLPFRPPDLYLPIFSSQVSEAAKKTHINNYESPSSIFFFCCCRFPSAASAIDRLRCRQLLNWFFSQALKMRTYTMRCLSSYQYYSFSCTALVVSPGREKRRSLSSSPPTASSLIVPTQRQNLGGWGGRRRVRPHRRLRISRIIRRKGSSLKGGGIENVMTFSSSSSSDICWQLFSAGRPPDVAVHFRSG